MKSFSKTISYLTKHGWVSLFLILPAFVFAFFVKGGSFTTFVSQYPNTNIANFGDLLSLLFASSYTNYVWFLLGAVLLVLSVSIYVGVVEKHFRSGTVKLNIGRNINNNVLAVITYFLCVFVIVLSYKFILSVLLYANHIIFSGLGNIPNGFTFAFSVALFAVSFVVLGYLFNYFLLAFPATVLNGYYMRTSLSDASELLNKKHLVVLMGMIVVLGFAFCLQLLGAIYGFSILANFVCYFVVFAFLPTYSFVCYYDFASLTRYDLPTKFKYTL